MRPTLSTTPVSAFRTPASEVRRWDRSPARRSPAAPCSSAFVFRSDTALVGQALSPVPLALALGNIIGMRLQTVLGAVLCAAAVAFSQSTPPPQATPPQATPPQATPAQATKQQIEAHSRQAQEFLSEGRPELAVREYSAILKLDPNNVDARGNLGVTLFFQGDYTNAAPHLRAALKQRPNLSKLEALLGMSERRIGQIAAAQSDLEK